MSEITRYRLTAVGFWEPDAELYEQEDPSGDWVRYDDHARIVAEKDAEIERLRNIIESAKIECLNRTHAESPWQYSTGFSDKGSQVIARLEGCQVTATRAREELAKQVRADERRATVERICKSIRREGQWTWLDRTPIMACPDDLKDAIRAAGEASDG